MRLFQGWRVWLAALLVGAPTWESVQASGQPQKLRLEFRNPTCQDPEATLRIELESGEPGSFERVAPLPQALTIPRPAAGTRLVWQSNRCLVPILRIGEETPATVSLEVLPVAWVQFALEKVALLEFQFAFANAFRWGEKAFSALSRCEKTEGFFRCPVPARPIHLRIQGQRGAPHYRWEVQAEPGETLKLGILPLRTGGSLVGWVESPVGEQLPPGLEVLALLEGSALRNPATLPWKRTPVPPRERVAAGVTFNGFFQVVGLRPGSYDLELRGQRRLVGSAADLLVEEGQETVLNETVRLSWPWVLGVRVDPPTDPEGRSWTVELHRRLPDPVEPSATYTDPVAAKETNPSGEVQFWELTPGRYSLFLRAGDTTLLEEVAEVGKEEGPLEEWVSFNVRMIEAVGRLRCRGEPMEGWVELLSFSRKRLAMKKAAPDEEGRFSTWIVRPEWSASLRVFEPKLGFRVHLLVTREPFPEEQMRWQVDVNLEGASLSGRVIGANGEPRARVFVELKRSPLLDPEVKGSDFTSARSGPEGSFEVPCISAGRWLLQASDLEQQEESQPVLLELRPGQAVREPFSEENIPAGRLQRNAYPPGA